MDEEGQIKASSVQHNCEIAIVGAGVAGCFAAYRLVASSQYTVDSRRPVVSLFEKSDRIGGRLRSEQHGKVVAELGGMRFFNEIPVLTDLIDHLGLSSEVTNFATDQPENFFYARGKRLKRKEITEVVLPYRLNKNELQKSPNELVVTQINSTMPWFEEKRLKYHQALRKREWALTRKLSEEYRTLKASVEINDKPLHHICWYDFLNDGLSEEAVRFIQDFEGYEIIHSNGSAASWLDNLFYTPPDVKLKCLKNGFQSVPDTLHSHFLEAGGASFLQHELSEIRKSGDTYILSFINGNKRTEVRCKNVILALPKPVLQRLSIPLLESPLLLNAFNSVKSIDAFKLFLTYPEAWWQRLDIHQGRSTTDLPLRQVYYHNTPGNDAMLMASYCNGPDTAFWTAIYNGNGPERLDSAKGEQKLMAEAHHQLKEMHGLSELPEPIAMCHQFWQADSGSSGWHVWQPKTAEAQVIQQVQRPNKEESLFIVGSCWSNEPGSVQGAIISTELMLQREFQLPNPSWLDPASLP